VLCTLNGREDVATPVRQNRRTPLIEAALEPARNGFEAATLKLLGKAVALLVSLGAIVVSSEVLKLNDAEARQVERWAIRAFVVARSSCPDHWSALGNEASRKGTTPLYIHKLERLTRPTLGLHSMRAAQATITGFEVSSATLAG
jgi:hypothetical protein